MKNNLLFIVFDSCRYDTFMAAKTPNIRRIGDPEQRFSYASWTVPSHTVYMMGASPHKNPRGVFASEVYKKDFINWGVRTGIPDISFKGFVPQLSLPYFLKQQGYRTNALVSMPVLNQTTNINNHFDRFQLMKNHNDFSAMIDELEFSSDQPSFYLMNTGETHYPYTLPGESNDLPIIHGMHGVFKRMDEFAVSEDAKEKALKGEEQWFDQAMMDALKDKQRANIEYLDTLFEKLFDTVPANTHLIVTSDHGELFGEDGFFGHGPVIHEKVFEVFFVEGLRP